MLETHDEGAGPGATLSVSIRSDAAPMAKAAHNVFENADLLVRLLIAEADFGYKLVTYYTTGATLYVALAGVTAQQYFVALSQSSARAYAIACFGLAMSIISLAAPVGLNQCRREIETRAAKYAAALGLPPERFSVIRFGSWLSLFVFATIAAAWISLLAAR